MGANSSTRSDPNLHQDDDGEQNYQANKTFTTNCY